MPLPSRDCLGNPSPPLEQLHAGGTETATIESEITMPLEYCSPYDEMKARVGYITEPGQAEQMVADIMHKPLVAFDTETVGHNIKEESPVGKARGVCMSFCWNNDEAWYVQNYGEQEGMVKIFAPWFKNEYSKKTGHNLKYDMHVLANHNVPVRGVGFDSMIGAWLLNENEPKALEEQMHIHFQEKWPTFKETFRYKPLTKQKTRRHKGYTMPSSLEEIIDPSSPLYQPRKLAKYAAKDAWLSWRLGHRHMDALSKLLWHGEKSMLDYYNLVENPYISVLFEMEREGVYIDVDYLNGLSNSWMDEMRECEAAFVRGAIEAGAPQSFFKNFNIQSPLQLQDLLYKVLELPTGRETKKGFSVDGDELSRLGGGAEFVKNLTRYNELNKLKGTYSDSLPLLIDKKGRVHTSFNQTGTVTGRLSSSNPNLQNIPVRSEDGQRIRTAFIAEPGMTLCVCDSSQIELRLMSHFSRDGRMIEGFNSGVDFHAFTAKSMFPHLADVSLKEIKENYSDERGKGKTLNFAIQYGMGPKKLSEDWGVSMEEAKNILALYNRTYANIGVFKRASLMFARQHGFVRTFLRRYRRVPDIDSSDRIARSYAEREVISSIIQGSASDLMKMAMILIHRSKELRDLGWRMLLQVHDELVNEGPEETAEEAKPIIQKFMAEPYKHFGLKPLVVATPAEGGIGPNWLEAKK